MTKKEKNIIGRRLRHSYLSSVISITLVLVLVGMVALFAANAQKVSNFFKENMVVSVILRQTATEQEAEHFVKELSSKQFVREADYVSKEDGKREMEELLGADFLNVFESNPIPISIDLKLDGSIVTKDSLNAVKQQLLSNKIVEEVVYQESLVEALNSNLKRIGAVLLCVILLLMFISFVLINNTVRLNVYSKRFTIHTMRLVGAKRSFIRKPFIKQAFIQGLISGLLASGLLAAGLYWLSVETKLFEVLFNIQIIAAVLAAVVVLGILICMISAMFVVNKLVYLSTDDLYY